LTNVSRIASHEEEVVKLGCGASLRTPISPFFLSHLWADGRGMENIKALNMWLAILDVWNILDGNSCIGAFLSMEFL
jgi:hypothetical protein